VENPGSIEGVYEFVSESTQLTKPKKETFKRTPPDWAGIWQFQKGHFTSVLMKARRDRFFARNNQDLGFESSAGSYGVKGKDVELTQTYTLSPFDVGGSLLMAYDIDGDTLTLTETLYPHVEDLREGTIVLVLRRLK
jgi:hypothetical protein